MRQRKTPSGAKSSIRELASSLAADPAFISPGIQFPHKPELEQMVLGAALQFAGTFQIVRRLLPKEAFWMEKHQTIYEAIQQITSRSDPVDTVTVLQEVEKMGLLFNEQTLSTLTGKKEEQYRQFAILPTDLLDCTARIASADHIEGHCRLLYEAFMRRKAIVECWLGMKRAQDSSFDVFHLYEHLEHEIRISNPQRVLRIQSMNEVMDEGEKEPPTRWMCGNLVKENEVCILFGDEGTGKSILAFQMADAASRGTNLFPLPDFENQCEQKLTIFYDFEMESSELFTRYAFQKEKYRFHENFKRGSLNPDFLDFENADELIINEIQRDIELLKPAFVIIDNMTYITSESQDPVIATKVMKRLLALQRKYKLTILVIAHTPKRDLSQPIENRHLAGAKNLSNFAKSIIAVSHSKKDIDKRYIKHTKCRNGRKIHDESNVIECVLHKEGTMLQYEYLGTCPEQAHLIAKDTQEVEAGAIASAYEERKKKGTPYRELAEEMKTIYDIDWSHTTIMRKLADYRKNKDLDIEPSERDTPI